MPSPERASRTRRGVLAGLAGLAAGCVGRPGPSATATPTGTPADPHTTDDGGPTPTGTRTAEPTGTAGTCCYHRIELSASEADRAEVADGWCLALADLASESRAVAEAALGGETAVEAWEGPPLDDGSYLVADGRYYRVDESVGGERTVTTYRFEAEVPARSEPPGEPLAYPDLTPEERRVVDGAVEGWEPSDGGYGRSYPVVFEDGNPDDCRFLDGGTYFVRYEGAVISLYHDSRGTTAMTTYRYRLPEAAASASAFADLVVREHVADPTAAGLGDAVLAVAETLFESGYYYSENPPSEATETFTYWLSDFSPPHAREVYARWERSLYAVEIGETMA